MAKAKDYAKTQLGDLDLSHLDKEREVAQNIYDTSRTGLDTNFSNLIDQINRSRQDYRRNFNAGRGTIAEQAFSQNRLNSLDVGSRIAGRSGLRELGQVGNRIETGRQYSNLANTFYNDMGGLDLTEKQGTDQYGLNQRQLENTLNQTLAGIGSRGNEAQNAYNMSLAQLAEQVQGRWDSNANAQAALAQQKAAAAQQAKLLKEQMTAAKQDKEKQDLYTITTMVGREFNGKIFGLNDAINAVSTAFGVDTTKARQMLLETGILSSPVYLK